MPNHETNNVVIIGTPANIRRFAAEAFIQPGEPFYSGEPDVNEKDFPLLDFDRIVPSPPNKEKGNCSGQHEPDVICWLDWNRANWGTKWGAYSHSSYALRYLGNERDGIYGRIDLRFETAWNAPTPIFEAIQERWELTVHAVTQDEGGFPDVEFGDPYGEEVLTREVVIDFDSYDREVDESMVAD